MKHFKLLILFFFIEYFSFAQGLALDFGYTYLNTSRLDIGLSYRLSKQSNKNPLNLNFIFQTNFSGKNQLIFGFQKRFLQGFESGINVSNDNWQPIVGINLFNFFKIRTGYCLPFHNSANKEFILNLTFSIGKKKYYDYLPIGF